MTDNPRLVYFDARSAALSRNSGWERYTRGIAEELSARTEVAVGQRNWRMNSVAARLSSDIVVQRETAGFELVHYPTYPPVRVREKQGTVLTVHDLTWWRYPETASLLGLKYYKPLLERAIARSSHIVTHSVAVADEVRQYFDLDSRRITAVFCGADSLRKVAARPPQRPRSKPFILAVGTIEPRKNLGRLTRAFSLSSVRATHDLVLVGRQGWSDAPPGIDWLGPVPDSELRWLYQHAAGVVVPSLYEGFGLPVAEAMAEGVPIACSDIPVFREVAGDGPLYFDPTSVDAIADALYKLISVGPVAPKLDPRFTWAEVGAALGEVYARHI